VDIGGRKWFFVVFRMMRDGEGSGFKGHQRNKGRGREKVDVLKSTERKQCHRERRKDISFLVTFNPIHQ